MKEFPFNIFKCISIFDVIFFLSLGKCAYCIVAMADKMTGYESGPFHSCSLFSSISVDTGQYALRGQLTRSLRADGAWTAPTHALAR